MLTMINKKKLALCVAGLLTINFTNLVFADDQKPRIPLQMAPDKAEFINGVVNEKVQKNILPFDDETLQKIKQTLLDKEKQLNAPIGTPEILYRTVSIDQSVPYQDQTVYLSPNYVTTLQVFDKMGSPWPIEKYILALSDKLYSDNISSNTLVLSSKKLNFGRGNLVITLKDLKSPVILSIEIAPNKVDYKTELRINGLGPESQPTVFQNDGNKDMSYMGKFAKEDLYALVEGVTPNNGKYIKRPTSLDGVEAWTNGKTLYVRTKDVLLSPGLLPTEYNKMQSADGTFLYTVPNISVLYLSRSGQQIQVKVD